MVFIWCARRAPRMDRGWFARHFFFVTCSFLDAGNSVIHVASNRNVPPNTCVTTDACKAFCSNNSRPPNCSKCRLVVRHVLLITLFLTLYISRPRMPEIPRHTCARNYVHHLPFVMPPFPGRHSFCLDRARRQFCRLQIWPKSVLLIFPFARLDLRNP